MALLSYFGGRGLLDRFGPSQAAAQSSLGLLLCLLSLSLAWTWNHYTLGD